MFQNKLIVEIIDNKISIYKNSLIVREPFVALIIKEPLSVLAIGKDVENYPMQKGDKVETIYPMKHGEIVDLACFRLIIDYYLAKIVKASLFLEELIVLIPTTCSNYERDKIYSVFKKCGARNIWLIEKTRIYCDYFGGEPVVSLTIGEDLTEIAILKNNEICEALSLNIGGKEICNLITDKVKEVYNLKIIPSTAEKILDKLGSLFLSDNTTMSIFGRDIYDNQIRENVFIVSSELYGVFSTVLENIYRALFTILETLPLEDLTSIQKNGILISGEHNALHGLTDYFAKNLSLKAHICQETDFDLVRKVREIKKQSFSYIKRKKNLI